MLHSQVHYQLSCLLSPIRYLLVQFACVTEFSAVFTGVFHIIKNHVDVLDILQLIIHFCLPDLPFHPLSKFYCNYKISSCVVSGVHLGTCLRWRKVWVALCVHVPQWGAHGVFSALPSIICEQASSASSHGLDPLSPIWCILVVLCCFRRPPVYC